MVLKQVNRISQSYFSEIKIFQDHAFYLEQDLIAYFKFLEHMTQLMEEVN